MMFRHILHLHGAEGAEPHMEGHVGDLYALGLDRGQQFRGKVQAGRGGGGGAVMFGIDRLVTVFVLQLVGDVGGRGICPSLSRISSKIPS